jgi:hypothetical protein
MRHQYKYLLQYYLELLKKNWTFPAPKVSLRLFSTTSISDFKLRRAICSVLTLSIELLSVGKGEKVDDQIWELSTKLHFLS